MISTKRDDTTSAPSTHTVLVERIKGLVQDRASYGYRRVAARLNATSPSTPAVNHKRAYRVMKANGLLLPKHIGRKVRVHDGKWCSPLNDRTGPLRIDGHMTNTVVEPEEVEPLEPAKPGRRRRLTLQQKQQFLSEAASPETASPPSPAARASRRA